MSKPIVDQFMVLIRKLLLLISVFMGCMLGFQISYPQAAGVAPESTICRLLILFTALLGIVLIFVFLREWFVKVKMFGIELAIGFVLGVVGLVYVVFVLTWVR
ncbi:hypothetical protein [Holophaga foetida]|uniref:hypothetical protein n=1 Tax=Holophaga foetida TaxID=35839 RepID=UPI00047B9C58|nr:hypothetical protein [Holophaga foetida]